LSVYKNTAVSSSDSALNLSLLSRWFINTADSTELGSSPLQLGTYEYTFTMGTFNKKVVINVIDSPSLDFTSVEIDSNPLDILNGVFYVDAAAARGRLTVNFNKLNLPSTVYVKVVANNRSSSLTVVTDPLVLGSTYLTLTNQTTLDLNRIAGAIPAIGSYNVLDFKFEFFKLVNFDSPEHNSTSTGRYVRIATQTLEIRAITAVTTPTVATPGDATTGVGISGISVTVASAGAERIYYTLDGSTPNKNSPFVNVANNAASAGVLGQDA
jgi:hypothetical protein